MDKKLRVAHYLNQFFGGIGGEEKADVAPQTRDGAVGPGRAINQILGDQGEVIGTVICGDNFYAERTEEAIGRIVEGIKVFEPDLLIAGPAFNAGRYGLACGEICKILQEQQGIPAVTGMYEENPGTDLFHQEVYIIKSDESVRGMNDAVSKMVGIGLKLVHDEPIGRPEVEGYFTRGIVRNEFTDKNAAERATDMLLARIRGDSYQPELELPKFDRVKPAHLQNDLPRATIALATDGGLVPKGNPDKMESNRSTRFAVYGVEGRDSLSPDEFEANHMGFDTALVNEDPNRLVPLDVLKDMEKEGMIGHVHNKVYTTAGVATSLKNAETIAAGIAASMKADGVDAVILTST
jgi:glycine reductase